MEKHYEQGEGPRGTPHEERGRSRSRCRPAGRKAVSQAEIRKAEFTTVIEKRANFWKWRDVRFQSEEAKPRSKPSVNRVDPGLL